MTADQTERVTANETVERKLVALVAGDAAGMARLMASDARETRRTLASHRNLLQDVASRHNGRMAAGAGDDVLIEFPSAVAAVECAVAIQRAMMEHNAGVPEDRRIRLRVGVNLGDVAVDGDDILGDGVNVAARLEAEAEPDGVCVSDDVMRQVRGRWQPR